MPKVRYMKCAQRGCNEVATWKAGTWWFCEEHMKELLNQFSITVNGMTHCAWGTAYEHGPCRAEDYFVGDYPESMTVEVEEP